MSFKTRSKSWYITWIPLLIAVLIIALIIFWAVRIHDNSGDGAVTVAPHLTPDVMIPPAVTIHALSTSATRCQTSNVGCAQAWVDMMNAERAKVGVGPLTLDWPQSHGNSTCIGSQGHAQHLATAVTDWSVFGTYAHDQFPEDLCPPYMTGGENVGAASGSKFSALVTIQNGMIAEPHDTYTCSTQGNHACNEISSHFRSVGVGIRSGALGWFYVSDFKG